MASSDDESDDEPESESSSSEAEPDPASDPESLSSSEDPADGTLLLGESSVLPVFFEHVGQAFMPCSALTRSATWICSSRLASSGCPEPPKARHVESVNCRPPPKPLPVLMAQFPLLSHSASASQSVSACAAGAASSAAGMTGAPAATTARVARPSRPGRRGAR